MHVFNATQGSIPKTISDLARNHDPRSHHHVVTAGVDMTVEPGMTAIRGPIGVAAVFSLFEVKDTHVFGPMWFRLHHHGDAVAGFLPKGSVRSEGGLALSSRNIRSISIVAGIRVLQGKSPVTRTGRVAETEEMRRGSQRRPA